MTTFNRDYFILDRHSSAYLGINFLIDAAHTIYDDFVPTLDIKH